MNKAIIIGSGVAGMATAIRLAAKGYRVTVFEKNACPGGKITDIKMEGYHFDAGPSLFTQPENITELFELAGEPIAEYFTCRQLETACKYFYENGKVVEAFAEREKFALEMQTKCNEDAGATLKYLQHSETLYNNIGTAFIDHSLHKRSSILSMSFLKALFSARPEYIFNTLHNFNAKAFKTEEAIQLFDRFATYNGSNPYKAPGMLSLIPHLEQTQGTFYPKGGMISITNALYNLALKKGVEFHFNTPVARIIENEGKVAGVVANHENHFAGIVVSNADVYFTYKRLLGNDAMANKIAKKERSSSALIFYWGIKKQFPALQLHNIFFSRNYKEEFNQLFNKHALFNDPTVYINITSKMEAQHAPPACENWFVMVNAPANTGQNWEMIKTQARENILLKLSRMLGENVEACIEREQVLDPVMIEDQTSSFMGSLYGTSSNSKFSAFLRTANFTKRIKGLYFCGGSVHPGGGIPLCLRSAKIVSGLIGNPSMNHSGH